MSLEPKTWKLKPKILNSRLITLFVFCFMLQVAGFVIPVPLVQAAVPTFDVGLNPKMDELLIKTEDIRVTTRSIECLIAKLVKKEFGPAACRNESSGSSSGLGSLGNVFNKIGSITSIFSGGNFDSLSGPAADTGNLSSFNFTEDSTWANDATGFEWDPEEERWVASDIATGDTSTITFDQGSQIFEVTGSSGDATGFEWDPEEERWVASDVSGEGSTYEYNNTTGTWDVVDPSGNTFVATVDPNSQNLTLRDSMGNLITNPTIINAVKSALKNIDAIKSIIKAVGGGNILQGIASLESLLRRAESIFGTCDSFDCMTRKMAEMALGFFQQQILNWMRTGGVTNGGIPGAPLFVRDWDRYLLDAANYASNVFLRELQATPLCEPFGTELKRIFSSGGGFNLGAISGGGFGGGISAGSGGSPAFNQRLNCSLNTLTTNNFQPLFDDFEGGGGWATWADITRPEANPFGQYLITMEAKELREARAAQDQRFGALSGDGFLGVKLCVTRSITVPAEDPDQPSTTVSFQDCPIVTPGIIQKEVSSKVAVSEQERYQKIHEMDELFRAISDQIVRSIFFSAGGLFSGSFSSSGNTVTPSCPAGQIGTPPNCTTPGAGTGLVQGFKVTMPGIIPEEPAASQTVTADGGSGQTRNFYDFSLTSGAHTIAVTVPSGWSAGYTLCYNVTTCHGNTPTPGNSVTVNVPAGGYADLWWHYTNTTVVTTPIIQNELAVAVSGTSVVITWNTSTPKSSRVIYGTTAVSDANSALAGPPNYGYTSSTIETDTAAPVLNHSVTVTGLTPGTTYYFRGVSRGSPEIVGRELQITTSQ